MSETTATTAARYWDQNRGKSKEPAYWIAHPACPQAIDRRGPGSPHALGPCLGARFA